MSPRTRRREEADRVLLTEGPKPVGEVMLLMLSCIDPGEAARAGAARRSLDRRRHGVTSPRKPDNDPGLYELGRRVLAAKTLSNAVRNGAWIHDEEDMLRHRDWQSSLGTTQEGE